MGWRGAYETHENFTLTEIGKKEVAHQPNSGDLCFSPLFSPNFLLSLRTSRSPSLVIYVRRPADPFQGNYLMQIYKMSSTLKAAVKRALVGCRQRDLVAVAVRGRAGCPATNERGGLWTVTVQFVFGSPLVAELRSEPKVKTHGGGQRDQRTTAHTGRERDGKRQWELVWRIGLNKQSSPSPAPYYPIIYTAWELGNSGCRRRPLVFSPEKWRSMPHANQKGPGIMVWDKFWILAGLMCLF